MGANCRRYFVASQQARAALAAARAVQPDLVLLDWEMPGMGGGEFVRRWRSDAAFSQPRAAVIMMAAHTNRSGVLAAVRLGIHEFLLKPVSSGALRARML